LWDFYSSKAAAGAHEAQECTQKLPVCTYIAQNQPLSPPLLEELQRLCWQMNGSSKRVHLELWGQLTRGIFEP